MAFVIAIVKILVTGASGFVGRSLIPNFLSRGHSVTTIGRALKAPFAGVPHIACPDSKWHTRVPNGDQFDLCLHLAWIAKPGVYLNSEKNDEIAKDSVSLALKLYQTGLPHFIGVGSGIEYSPEVTGRCREDCSDVRGSSPYASAKIYAAKTIRRHSESLDAGFSWIRIFYPYGPGEHSGRITSIILSHLSKRQPLELRTPDSIKDFIEIRDIVSGITTVAEYPSPFGYTNLGTGIGTSIKDLAAISAAALNLQDPKITHYEPPIYDPYAKHISDPSKLLLAGWKPKISIESGIKNLASYFKFSENHEITNRHR